jgi:hypothetical protein
MEPRSHIAWYLFHHLILVFHSLLLHSYCLEYSRCGIIFQKTTYAMIHIAYCVCVVLRIDVKPASRLDVALICEAPSSSVLAAATTPRAPPSPRGLNRATHFILLRLEALSGNQLVASVVAKRL